MMDPPEHDRFRALVSRVFTPRAVTALEPMIREVIRGYLDPLNDASEFDVGRRLRRAVPGRGDLAHARRARRRAPADPPLARREPPPRAGPDRAEPRERAGHRSNRACTGISSRWRSARTRATTCSRASRRSPSTAATARRPASTTSRSPGFAVAPRRRGRRDGHEARRQRGGPVRAAPRPVAQDPRRPREDPARRRRDPPLPGRRRSTRAGTAWRSASSRAARFPRASPCSSSPARRRATRARSSAPTSSTSNGNRASASASATVCTAASAPRSARMESRIAIEELAQRWRELEVDEAGLRRVNMANVAGYSNVPVRAVR